MELDKQNGRNSLENNNSKTSSKNSDVQELRSLFLKEYEQNKDDYDEQDLKKICGGDFWVQRFINYRNQGKFNLTANQIDY